MELYAGLINVFSTNWPQDKNWEEFLHKYKRTQIVFHHAQVESLGIMES